jgi:hypothetical protein
MAGRGLLIRLWGAGRLAFELGKRGGGRRESGRAGDVLEGSREDETETNGLNSRMYHDTSSSSTCSSSSSSASVSGNGDKGASVNSKISTGLASGFEGDGIERVIASGWKDMGGEMIDLGGGWRYKHSSSEAPGVIGVSVLEQADMLVSEGVGERVGCGDRRVESCWREEVLEEIDDSHIGGEGSEGGMSMIISNSLMCAFWGMVLVEVVGGGRGADRGALVRKSSSRPP